MANPDIKRKRIFDTHAHIGAMGAFRYYGVPEPINPTVIEYATTEEFLKEFDGFGVDRAVALSNYGLPDSAQPFTPEPPGAGQHSEVRSPGGRAVGAPCCPRTRSGSTRA